MTLFGPTGTGALPTTWGGYTYPITNPVIMQIAPRVDAMLVTAQEGSDFANLVIGQHDIVPPGQPVYVRQLTDDEMKIDPVFLMQGLLPLVLEFAGPLPSPSYKATPPKYSSVVLTTLNPAYFSVVIGMMYASAPHNPGVTSSLGPQAFNRNFKLQIKSDGSMSWVGLDQPTWQGVVSTATGSNPNA